MTSWRSDPDLAGKLHPQHPDDVQVLVHDGEPRRTQRAPEGCWVRITGTAGLLSSPVTPPGAAAPPTSQSVRRLERVLYVGELLNQPHHLQTLSQGSIVHFVHAPGMPAPLLVTRGYEAERPRWAFTPCDRCGADQALDPPSIMARTRFPSAPAGAVPVAFSAFCPCGGTMMLAQIEEAAAPAAGAVGASAPRTHSSLQPARGGSGAGRMLLFAGLGCLGLVAMCCLSGLGGIFWQRSGHESVARAHVESFLGMVQARQWDSALAAAEYGGDSSLYTAGQLGACLMATPLAEMSSYGCASASAEWPIDDGADVVCTVATPRGATEITVTVNNTDALPYLGYVWFSGDATLGTAWRGDDCARWSGRDYVDDAPADRVRP